jgi:hypothetical protein
VAAAALAALVATVGLVVAPWSASAALAAWVIEGRYPIAQCISTGEAGRIQGRWVAYTCERDIASGGDVYLLWVDIRSNTPPPPRTNWVNLQAGGGTCLDVLGANSQNGTPVHLWQCGSNNPAQQWTTPGDNTYRAFGKCLDARGGGTSNGTVVQIWDCNGTGAQKWVSINTVGATTTLMNPQSGRCLDKFNGGTTNGTPVQLWDCNGTAAQRWTYAIFS